MRAKSTKQTNSTAVVKDMRDGTFCGKGDPETQYIGPVNPLAASGIGVSNAMADGLTSGIFVDIASSGFTFKAQPRKKGN